LEKKKPSAKGSWCRKVQAALLLTARIWRCFWGYFHRNQVLLLYDWFI